MTKTELRHAAKAKLACLSESERERLSAEACAAVSQLDAFSEAKTVFAYKAVKGECSPEYLVDIARKLGKKVAFPKCGGNSLEFYAAKSDSDFVPGAFGIPEPDPLCCEKTDPEDADLIIVPGLAFDRSGARLGRGGGYYDRFLPLCCGKKVGFCFECQVFDAVAAEKHDSVMDIVATNRGIIVNKKQ